MSLNEFQTGKEKTAERPSPCQVTFTVEGESYKGTSVHFNERGMLIMCDKPAMLYSKVNLSLMFPGAKSPIWVSGEVVWTNIYGSADSLSPRGMGVKFFNLDRETERLLNNLSTQYESYGNLYACYYN